MPIVNIRRDAFNPTKAETYQANCVNLADWMTENVIANQDANTIQVVLNGHLLCDTGKMHQYQCNKSIDRVLCEHDSVDILIMPMGLDPLSLVLIGVAISLVAVQALVPKPDIPNLQGQQATSPNNQLKSATNGFRINQAIADIYGRRRVTPDFAAPSYWIYENNQKIVKELFVVGEGYYDFTEARFGESEISDLPDSTATFYEPGDLLPADQRRTVVGSNSVDGQELIAPNDPSLVQAVNTTINTDSQLEFPNTDIVFDELGLGIGDEFNLNFDAGAGNQFNGTVEISNITDTGSVFEVDVVGTPFSVITTQPSTDSDAVFSVLPPAGDAFANWTDWFVLDGSNLDDIWVNLQAPQGLADEDQKEINIEVTIQAREVDDVGPFQEFDVTLTGSTTQPQFRTYEVAANITVPPNKSEIRLRRKTDLFPAGSLQSVKIEEAWAVTDYSDAELVNDNFSMAYLERRATTLSLAPQSPKFNVIAQRKLRLFDTGSGTIDPTETATRSFADAVFHILYFKMGIPLNAIDTESLFDISDGLAEDYLGYFDYSFDDKNIDGNQRIVTACDVARVLPFKSGGRIWTFVRDEEKPVRSALLNRRNMPPQDTNQTWSFRKPRDYDSVALTYVNFDENQEVTIYRSIDNNGVISNTAGVNTNEFTLSGCVDEDQAENRIDFEIRKIKYQRIAADVTAMNDGLYIGLGDRVGWADINDSQIFDGEILGESGTEYDTSEAFRPEGGETYYCYLTDNEGVPTASPFVVTARLDTEFGFSGLAGQSFLPTGKEQIGSRYIIAKQSDLDLSDFTVTSRGGRDENGNVQIGMVNYDPRVYSQDP